ncbi:MAG: 50S ribosomal protein L11 methyltransferase [Bacteroidetes bacterium]|nr:50S ribosomal protein L11 methyltransferase [Bacteroidota bacterium]
MDYLELTCIPETGPHTSELLIAKLADIGFESFTEEPGLVCAYIPFPQYNDEVRLMLKDPELKNYIKSFSTSIIADQNWNATWESNYEAVHISENCMVRAPFHPKTITEGFDIVIEPKMSFGTAHHETTHLMMLFLLNTDVKGKHLLDMGCGTGVLAILASMKGASPVLAIDNDEWAFRNSLENVENNVPGKIEVLLGDSSLLKEKMFDMILANINRNILLQDLPEFTKALTINGLIFLSGFYEEDLPVINQKAQSCGLSFLSSMNKNKWTAACFMKTT